MNRLIYKILATWVFLTCAFITYAQNGSTQSKTITESYLVGDEASIEIKNKYGQIIVNTWEKKEVKVEVVVTAYGKNRSAGEKILSRVDFDFNKVNNYVILETVLDRKSGFFKDLLNNIGDYSKTLLSKNKLDIDYELYVPENASIKIENKFGDVFLADVKNNCEVKVSNGNLKAQHLEGNATIGVSFGNAYVKSIQDGSIELKVADIEIDNAYDISINSSSSEIVIHQATKVRLNSRNDKLKISKIDHLAGKSSFSKIEVNKLLQLTDMDMSYGFLSVSEVDDSFSKIQLTGKSTDFNLSFDQRSYFNAMLLAKEDRLVIPRKIADVEIDSDDEFVSVKGTIGNKNNKPAFVNIDAQKGDLKVFFVRGSDN